MNEAGFPEQQPKDYDRLPARRRGLSIFRNQNAARRRRRFRAVPIRLIIPNLVTLLALCMGLTAIRFAIEGNFEISVLAVIAAAILDGLDGRLARALRGTSRFGAELDSLADFVDFGVLILYLWGLDDIKSLGWFAALVFASACALRLARFNVAAEDPDTPAWHVHFFTGMPAPAGAIIVLLPLYLHLSVFALPNHFSFVPFEIAYVLFAAFLMVSRIPHFSAKKIGRIPREYIIFVLFSIIVLVLLLATFPMEMMVFLSFLYLATIPFAIRRFRAFEAKDRVASSTLPV
jgi:CDP-diacylglycerol--serine O-phosphatidyltransferase